MTSLFIFQLLRSGLLYWNKAAGNLYHSEGKVLLGLWCVKSRPQDQWVSLAQLRK